MQRLDKLLIESPAPSPPLLWLPGSLASILTRVLKVPTNVNHLHCSVYCIHAISVTSVKIQFPILGPKFCNLGCHFLSPQIHDKILLDIIKKIFTGMQGLLMMFAASIHACLSVAYMSPRYQDIVYGQVN